MMRNSSEVPVPFFLKRDARMSHMRQWLLYLTQTYFKFCQYDELQRLQPLKIASPPGYEYSGAGGGGVVDPHSPPLCEWTESTVRT